MFFTASANESGESRGTTPGPSRTASLLPKAEIESLRNQGKVDLERLRELGKNISKRDSNALMNGPELASGFVRAVLVIPVAAQARAPAQ